MDRVEGLVPVMPTPFRDGQVDAEGIELLVAWVAPLTPWYHRARE